MHDETHQRDIPGGARTAGDAGAPGQDASPGDERESLSGIGAVASRTGVSERTLRYYEELGLLRPAAHRRGGSRLYCESDIERVERIRKLQSLMGFNLEEIRSIFAATDRLEALRAEYGTADSGHQHELLEASVGTLEDLRAQVLVKQEHLRDFLAELDDRIERHRSKLASWVELQRDGGSQAGDAGDGSPQDETAGGDGGQAGSRAKNANGNGHQRPSDAGNDGREDEAAGHVIR